MSAFLQLVAVVMGQKAMQSGKKRRKISKISPKSGGNFTLSARIIFWLPSFLKIFPGMMCVCVYVCARVCMHVQYCSLCWCSKLFFLSLHHTALDIGFQLCIYVLIYIIYALHYWCMVNVDINRMNVCIVFIIMHKKLHLDDWYCIYHHKYTERKRRKERMRKRKMIHSLRLFWLQSQLLNLADKSHVQILAK